MNRFLQSWSARFGCSLILTLGLIVVVARAEPAKPARLLKPPIVPSQPNSDKQIFKKAPTNDIRQKYDLTVSEFSGFQQGKYYYFNAKIKNIGQAAYPGGRYAMVYCGGSGHMHRREPIPALQPGAEHTIPGFRIEVGPLTPSNHFTLRLTQAGPKNDEDSNPNNDLKATDAFELIR